MQKHRESIRLFENEWLEKLSHVHPIIPLIVWMPVVAFFIYRSWVSDGLDGSTFALLAASGFFFWTLAEYILHRYIFHFQGSSLVSKRFHFIIHGNHHSDPQDPTRLVMPPAAGAALAAMFYWLFRAVLGPVRVDPFFAFFILGYLAYDYTHFAVHHFTPRTRWGKWIKQNHMIHHFQAHDALWGVSSPLWDYVFRTARESKRGVSPARKSARPRSRESTAS